MKRRDPDVYLGHIEDAIRDVNQYLGDYTWEEFLDDGKTQDAVMRKLEVIGEAVKNFPEEFLEKWPDNTLQGKMDVLVAFLLLPYRT